VRKKIISGRQGQGYKIGNHKAKISRLPLSPLSFCFRNMDMNFPQEEDNNNYLDTDSVCLNGFCFCARHSLELCPKCPTDNRGINNMQVEDYLHEQCSEAEFEAKWKGDDRPPLNVSHRWTKLSNGKPACSDHKQIGCEECFNWGQGKRCFLLSEHLRVMNAHHCDMKGLLREIKGEKKIRKASKKSKKDTL
jgi:hypothetical protein